MAVPCDPVSLRDQVLKQYHEYLQEQMVKEAEDEAYCNGVRKEAEARIWDQREAQLKAQQDARERLMQQVPRLPATSVVERRLSTEIFT